MSEPRRFAARVTQEGRLVIAEPLVWKAALARHRGQVVYVLLESLKVNRSTAQNRRYWSLLVPLVAEVLTLGGSFHLSSDQAHEVLKMAFLGHVETPLGNAPKSSKTLTVEEFSVYCTKIEHWLLHDHGVVVPERGESLEEMI